MSVAVLMAIVFGPMIVEAQIAARHERALWTHGATEPSGDVYAVMRLAYPGCFLAMLAEAWVRGTVVDGTTVAGVVVYGLAKALKYWAIATLGERWTFRVLVPLNPTCVTAGPYRHLRHPNYLAVVGELVGVALATQAWLTGPVAIVGFCLLIRARVRVEDRALGRVPE